MILINDSLISSSFFTELFLFLEVEDRYTCVKGEFNFQKRKYRNGKYGFVFGVCDQ